MASKRVLFLALALLLMLTAGSAWGESLSLPSTARAFITTPLNPAFYALPPGGGLMSGLPSSGIARLIINMPSGTFGCSGSLLWTGQDILTAAHCVTSGGHNPTVNSLSASFMGGAVTAHGVSYFTPPGWNGDFGNGSDLAIVHLDHPVALPGYHIDDSGLFGPGDVAGYGRSGLGSTGTTGGFGTLRAGMNDVGDTLGGFANVTWAMPGNPYAYDFDDGTAAHDALCLVAGSCSTGFGDLEVMIAPGDSGGPSFINGLLAGVHSFGATFGLGWGDIDGLLNSSFGELGGDTRVAAYADWINQTLAPVPEPASMLLLGSGLSLLGLRRRKK